MGSLSEALASVLYPNSIGNSSLYQAGKALTQANLPMQTPWANFFANAAQGLVGGGLQGYGARLTNEANAENAAKMVPQLGNLGVQVSPEIQSGLTSTDPQKRALALALTERQMNLADKKASNDAEFDMFKRKKDYEAGLEGPKATEASKAATRQYEGQLANRVDGDELKTFQTTHRLLQSMSKAALRDDKQSDIALISGISKLGDPTSSVREGEFKVNADLLPVMEKQFGNLRAVVEGKARLTESARAKILSAAQEYWDAARSNYELKADPIQQQAVREGLNPLNVVYVPYKRDAYKSVLDAVPNEDAIRQAWRQQAQQQQLAAIPQRSPSIGAGLSSPETSMVAPAPAPAPDENLFRVGPNTYVRIRKGE